MNYIDALNFNNRVAVVTGSGGSIGREIAKGFALCGANVVAVDFNRDALTEIMSELNTIGGSHLALCADVTNQESVRSMVKSVIDKYGRIDFLSNHAGTNIRKPAIEFTEQDWDKLSNCNLKGIFLVAQEVGKVMINQKYGRIVNTGSVSSVRGHKNLAIYAATKGGIMQLTKVLAHEWASYGVNVNMIGPGYVKTNQTADLINDPTKFAELKAHVPMGRLGECDEIVGPILFLCSPLANYITGHSLFVEGGRLID